MVFVLVFIVLVILLVIMVMITIMILYNSVEENWDVSRVEMLCLAGDHGR